MRHRSKVRKLKRTADHRRSLLANLACDLIQHGSIRTTLGKAKALRPIAEKMVTFAKKGDLHSRRQAVAFLRHKNVVQTLFDKIGPANESRQGGYCRITKLGPRTSDAALMGKIEWVETLEKEEIEEEVAVEEEASEESSAS